MQFLFKKVNWVPHTATSIVMLILRVFCLFLILLAMIFFHNNPSDYLPMWYSLALFMLWLGLGVADMSIVAKK